jgi:hypothetical protein
MDRERAETYLRQLAEAELRARTWPAALIAGRGQGPGGLALVEPAQPIRSGPTSILPSPSASPARRTRPARVRAGCRRTRGGSRPG